MAALNSTSVNTLRIFTLRNAEGIVEHVGSMVRSGSPGRRRDNLSGSDAGYGYPIDYDTGVVGRRAITYKPFPAAVPGTASDGGDGAPLVLDFSTALDLAITLSDRFPYSDFLGWDFVFDAGGSPRVLEVNINWPGYKLLNFVYGSDFTPTQTAYLKRLAAKS